MRFGVPVSLMGLLLHGGLNSSLLGMALVAVTAIAVMLTLLRLATPFSAALSHPDLQLGSCIGNTAYFGIPAALACFRLKPYPSALATTSAPRCWPGDLALSGSPASKHPAAQTTSGESCSVT